MITAAETLALRTAIAELEIADEHLALATPSLLKKRAAVLASGRTAAEIVGFIGDRGTQLDFSVDLESKVLSVLPVHLVDGIRADVALSRAVGEFPVVYVSMITWVVTALHIDVEGES